MKVSAAGRKAIAGHEGVRLKAYPDPATGGEPWTIGCGHTSAAGLPKVYKGLTITADECDDILSRDLATFERAVENAVTVSLNQNQFDALVSFTFNVGAGNFKGSTLLRKLNAGDYRGAADQFPVWNKAAGKVMQGLVSRRADERALFLKPVAVPATTSKMEALQTVPPPAVIVSDAPIPKPNLWARLSNIFRS
jgi:GH24 family phage-related lysozyme (muramidase)